MAKQTTIKPLAGPANNICYTQDSTHPKERPRVVLLSELDYQYLATLPVYSPAEYAEIVNALEKTLDAGGELNYTQASGLSRRLARYAGRLGKPRPRRKLKPKPPALRYEN